MEDITLAGIHLVAHVDTGSQVTTVQNSWFQRYLANSVETFRFHVSLDAANGEPLPTLGCFTCDLGVGPVTVKDVVVVIIPDCGLSQPVCLLGTNALGRIPQFVPRVTSALKVKSVLIRAPQEKTVIPALSVCHVTVSAGSRSGLDNAGLLLAEPAATPPAAGLGLLPSLFREVKGTIRVPVFNNTQEDLVLPSRNVLGRLVPAAHSLAIKESTGAEDELQESPGLSDSLPGAGGTGPTGPDMRQVETDLDRLETNPDLAPGDAALLRDVLRRHHDCFAWSDLDLGVTNLIQHEIHLLHDTPIAQRYRRLPPSCLDEVRAHLNDLQAKGIISPSSSPYASPIVVVRKKSGELRLCVDYRQVNAISRRDQFPLPRIDESLDALHGSSIFSSLDLASGYYQIPMKEEDKLKTSFTCPFGLYEFNRMPFGLSGGPATCQRLMNQVMSDFIFSCLLVYLDDLLLYSPDFADHLKSLELVLGRLRAVGLKLNPEKCQFAKDSVKFLGHVVSAKGIDTDPDKVAAIRDWKQPTTVKELRSFLGLASYYRRFVPNFSRIARPLNMLVSQVHQLHPKDKDKGEKLKFGSLWTEACTKAFVSLKAQLVSDDTVLQHPDFSQPFVVEVDASIDGIGAILSQGGRPIMFASRSLRGAEKAMRNYSSFKLELLGLKWAVADKFRPYLLGSRFTVYTDNSALVHLRKAKLAAVEMRWVAEATAVGDMTIQHKAGKINRNADACSRYPVGLPEGPDLEVTAVSAVQVHPSSRDSLPLSVSSELEPPYRREPSTLIPSVLAVKAAVHQVSEPPVPTTDIMVDGDWATLQDSDADIALIKQWLANKHHPVPAEKSALSTAGTNLWRHRQQLLLEDGVLLRICQAPLSTSTAKLPVVPPCHQPSLLRRAHDDFFHHGQDRTYLTLKQRVYWPGMKENVHDYISSCARCQVSKKGQAAPQPPGQLKATQPLEVLALDFLQLDQASNGMTYALVMTDIFSRYSLAFPCHDQTAHTVVTKLVEQWFPYFGVPMRIHSDQGRQFEGKVVQELCQQFGIKKSSTTPYHPQGNGMTERFNGTLINLLRSLSPEDKLRWPALLPAVCFAYNTTPHATTGLPPFQLLLGTAPRTPLDLYLGRQPPSSPGEEYILRHCERVNRLREKVESGQPLQAGDAVVERNHLATKLDDRYRAAIGRVLRVPSADGEGPVVVLFPDGERHLHSTNLKRVPPPKASTPPTAEGSSIEPPRSPPASRLPRPCPRVSDAPRRSARPRHPPRRNPEENYAF